MSEIQPGMMLEARRDLVNFYQRLERGRIYICQTVSPFAAWQDCSAHANCRRIGVTVREAPTPGGLMWCSDLFRPVRKPDTAKLYARLDIHPPPAPPSVAA